jgi:hypothetical protein
MGRRRAAHAAEANNNQVETVHKMPRGAGPSKHCLGEAKPQKPQGAACRCRIQRWPVFRALFASGCAALIYETVWFYLVQLVVGASSLSVA